MNDFQFLHIEKTAGMSLHAILHRDYLCYLSPDSRAAWNPDEKRWPIGNFSNGGHSIVSSERFKYQFTVMRDPLTRYLSHFNWRKNIMGETWSFEEFLDKEEYNNFQFKKMQQYTRKQHDSDILDHFSLVGIFEDFEKTMRILCQDLNIRPVIIRENQKKYEQKIDLNTITSTQRQKCLENNTLDTRLYIKAKEALIERPMPSVHVKYSKGIGKAVKAKQKILNLLTRAPR